MDGQYHQKSGQAAMNQWQKDRSTDWCDRSCSRWNSKKITVTVTFDGKADTQTAEYEVNVNLWNGLHTNEDGIVCLYKDGVVDTSATGIMEIDGQWLYLNEGQFQPDYNGVAKVLFILVENY